MNETEYLKATNQAKIHVALDVVRSICSGEAFGISDDDVVVVMRILQNGIENLTDLIDEEDPE